MTISRAMLDRLRQPVMMVIDLIIVNLSMGLAFSVRFDWHLEQGQLNACICFMILASAIRIVLFFIFGLYQWSFRHASISEAVNVFKTVTIGSLLLISIAFFAQSMVIGRSVLIIDYLICFFCVITSRFLPKVITKFRQINRTNLKKVLIVGAGAAGEMVAREMINEKIRVYQPVGFIDDNPMRLKSCIHGIKVLGSTNDIKSIASQHNVDEIIIAIPSASGRVIRDVISKSEKLGIKIKTIPGLHKILTGEVSIKQIRDFQSEDLLGRETVQIDKKDIADFIKDKIVLVSGAGGSIGSEICRQIIKYNPKSILMYDYNENDTYFLELELKENYSCVEIETIVGDIKDVGLLKNTFSKYRPNVVFHSAAHKHVPLMEANPAAAVKNNIIGTRNFLYAAEHYRVESFVMISTDKAVNPTNIMGASKRIAEMMIQAKAMTSRTKFMAVRFGNVIGSKGSVVPIFKKQIEKGGPVTVTHPDIKRFFMTASEAAQLVIQAGAIGKGGEIFILDMGEQMKIMDLAKNLIILSGLQPEEDIEIKFIGLRPGEKMSEETLLDTENDKATKIDKIYVTKSDNFDQAKLREDLKILKRLADLMATKELMAKIKEMVPAYNPNGNNFKEKSDESRKV